MFSSGVRSVEIRSFSSSSLFKTKIRNKLVEECRKPDIIWRRKICLQRLVMINTKAPWIIAGFWNHGTRETFFISNPCVCLPSCQGEAPRWEGNRKQRSFEIFFLFAVRKCLFFRVRSPMRSQWRFVIGGRIPALEITIFEFSTAAWIKLEENSSLNSISDQRFAGAASLKIAICFSLNFSILIYFNLPRSYKSC